MLAKIRNSQFFHILHLLSIKEKKKKCQKCGSRHGPCLPTSSILFSWVTVFFLKHATTTKQVVAPSKFPLPFLFNEQPNLFFWYLNYFLNNYKDNKGNNEKDKA